MPFLVPFTLPFTIGEAEGEEGGPVAPLLEPEAARLLQQILPVARHDDRYGFAATHLCAVLTAPIERLASVVLDDGDRPGYSRMLNVDDADVEDLRWLGLFNGTALSGTEPEEEQRRLIREARGSHRGTTRALVSDVAATLTGEQRVRLIERDPDPFQNVFITRPAETANEAAARAALNDRHTKPLGTINTLVVSDSPLIDEGTRTIDASTGTIDTATLGDIT